MTTQTLTLGQYLRFLREERGYTLDDLSLRLSQDGLKVGKPQLSHIENDRRDPSGDTLEKLIAELAPSIEQMSEMQSICERDSINVDLPPLLKTLRPVSLEFNTQRQCDEVNVVAEEPIELMDISPNNEFIMKLVEELKESPRSLKYVYWTTENSIKKFKDLFAFLGNQGISESCINKTFEIVIMPQQLSTLSYAIYSTPKNNNQLSIMGRILLKNTNFYNSLQVTAMGQVDAHLTYKRLKDLYNRLNLDRSQPVDGCRIIPAEQMT
jgi:transcriptional regulator with XRE-family HTH domain